MRGRVFSFSEPTSPRLAAVLVAFVYHESERGDCKMRQILNRHLKAVRRRRNVGTRRDSQCQATRFTPQLESLEGRRLLAAAIFEVSNLDDSGPGSLRAAIADANANPGDDTIRFDNSLQGEIELDADNGQLVITDHVTIRGPGADKVSVDGAGATRVFAVVPADLAVDPLTTPTLTQVLTSPTVTIERLAITNGLATDAPGFDPTIPGNEVFAFGGGLYNLGGSVQLRNVSMSGNTAENVVTAGGAVANEFGGTLTVSRSHFEQNTSDGFLIAVGGAITSDLGPVIDQGELVTTATPEVSIERSSFVENTAEAQFGYIDGEGFSGMGAGGAILNVTGTMSIERSHFEANQALGGSGGAGSTLGGPAFGGAITSGNISPFGISESSLLVKRSSFVGNAATAGDGGAAGLAGGQANGGAVAVNNLGVGELLHNQFVGNMATGGVGGSDAAGGIATGGAVATAGGASLMMKRNLLRENSAVGGEGTGTGSTAAGRGGGLGSATIELAGFVPGPATASVRFDRFDANSATGAGGGIFNQGSLSVHRSTLTDNVAVGDANTIIDFYPGYEFQGAALGGGISNLGSVEIVGSRFDGNQAVGADGASGPSVLLTDPADNVQPTYPGLAVGGGLHNLADATVKRSVFVDNGAIAGDNNQGSFAGVANGGGIYNDGSLSFRRSTMKDSLASGGDNNSGDINVGGAYGGGISSGTVTALFGLRSASIEVHGSRVTANRAVGGDDNTVVGLTSVPQAHQPGAGIGGGILVFQGEGLIRASQVTRNVAAGGTDAIGAGGGIFALGFIGPVDVEVFSSQVSRNKAIGGDGENGLGGGIAASSLGSLFGGPVDVSVARSVVFANLARGTDDGDGWGGGIFNDEDSTLDLTRSLVFGNRARGGASGDGVGGGLYNLGAVDLTRSYIFANFASTSDDNWYEG